MVMNAASIASAVFEKELAAQHRLQEQKQLEQEQQLLLQQQLRREQQRQLERSLLTAVLVRELLFTTLYAALGRGVVLFAKFYVSGFPFIKWLGLDGMPVYLLCFTVFSIGFSLAGTGALISPAMASTHYTMGRLRRHHLLLITCADVLAFFLGYAFVRMFLPEHCLSIVDPPSPRVGLVLAAAIEFGMCFLNTLWASFTAHSKGSTWRTLSNVMVRNLLYAAGYKYTG